MREMRSVCAKHPSPACPSETEGPLNTATKTSRDLAWAEGQGTPPSPALTCG